MKATNGTAGPEPLRWLTGAIIAYKSAESFSFEARKLHRNDLIGKMTRQNNHQSGALELVTRQRYYSCSCAGVNYVRVESTADFGGRDLTTVFIKNRDGIWDILPAVVCEVSGIFRRDQLLATFPLLRFFSAIEYPYELNIDESHEVKERIVIKGGLAAKPPQCDEDIASHFSYTISRSSGHLCSLFEKTFAGKSLELVLDSVALNRPLEERLFELPNRRTMTTSSLSEYMDIRMREWATALGALNAGPGFN